jgi:histone-lysine N-methyltransferase SETMAR
MEWKHPGSLTKKKFKTRPAVGKVMLMIFWDMVEHIYCNYLEGQKTINGQYYSDLLKNKARPALLHRCLRLQGEGVSLLQDNTHPHSVQLTQQTMFKMGWEVLPHPAYSSKLSSGDMHLSGPMKEALHRKHSVDNDEVRTYKYLQD